MTNDAPIHSFNTQAGALLVFKDKVRISRSGCLSFMRHGGKGDKDIPVSSITAIQLKEPGLTGSGYLQFNLSGGNTSTGGVFSASKDENTVMLSNKHQYDKAKKAKTTIENLMRKDNSSEGNNKEDNLSDIEKIERYHSLLEKGAISEEEYKKKKKEVFDNADNEQKLKSSQIRDIEGEEIESSHMQEENRPWYDNGWMILFWFFLFFPVGLYGIFKTNRLGYSAKWIVVGGFVIISVAGIITEELSSTEQSKQGREQVRNEGGESDQEASEGWQFDATVVYENLDDTAIKAQVEQRIYVSGDVSEAGLRSFLKHRYEQLSDRGGFTHFDSPTNIFVYVFDNKSRAEQGGMDWIGAVMKGYSDETPDIQVRSDL